MEKLNNKLMIAVSAIADHGKSDSTRMLIDLLYFEFVTKHKGWKAEIYDRRTAVYNPYVPGGVYTKDRFVVFSHNDEMKISVITDGDVWNKNGKSDRVAIYWQELLKSKNVSVSPMKLQDSLEVVVGCCHPNNDVKDKLMAIAKISFT